MLNQKKILCIIPARSGSKGVKNKNIRLCFGKPLIAWTIEQAKASKYIDTVIVSTDSFHIARISRSLGAGTPFLRPKSLSLDRSAISGAILHAISALKQSYGVVLLLQPTSPLRSYRDIDNALELLTLRDAQAIVSVTLAEHHPNFYNRLPGDLCMKDFISSKFTSSNRQDMPPFYRLNGAVYVAYTKYFLKYKNFFGPKTFAYIMPPERSLDIDTIFDFYFAEFILSKLKNSKKKRVY